MQRSSSLHRLALLALPLLMAATIGCKKEFDTPPVRTIPSGSVVTIAQLKAMYQGAPVHFADTAGAITTVYAVVTADEQNGNLYKNLYIQDHTGAMAIRLLNSGGLYQGDSIRIHLPGTVLSPYNGLMQLDSINVDNNVVKQATGVQVTPRPTLITELTSANFGLGGPYQSMVIKLNEVQFVAADTNQAYANAVTQQTLNRTLENCAGNTAVVRTSGYANFAGQKVPSGKGSFTGIASWFGSAAQLYIRDINEVQLNGPRCGMSSCDPIASLDEQFGSVQNAVPIDLDCWLNVFTHGDGIRRWRGGVSGAGQYAEATVSSAETGPVEYWLVTPPLTYSPGMALSFSSAIGSTWLHNGLSVHISTNINLTDAASVLAAPWQSVTAPLAGSTTPVGEWVPSGTLDLSGYLTPGATFVIGFKYVGGPAPPNNTPYRIDNVQVN
ncbi:MAG TPA: DUF5689 domain-containing protein [Flavobacteriales bacterium]|nr:DUF5689 domain-containing protein [Flavobacteriales bacterium]